MAISTYKIFLMHGTTVNTYKQTSDSAVQAGKTYYTRTGTSPNYVYTPVAVPTTADIATYYEVDTSTTTYNKLVDIKDFPNLGGEPEMIEVTTLSDKMQKFIAGIQQLESMSFTANYDKAEFTALKALEHTTGHYAVWFGGTESNNVVTPTGSDGKFSFDGELSVYAAGAGVNEAVNMTITIAPSTVIDFE